MVGVLGNGAIWFVLKRFKPLRTIPNILLANLAAIDLSNIIVNVPLFIAYHVYEEGTFNTSSAAWWTTFLWVLFIDLNTTSMLILVLDRYFGIVHGLKYNLWKTRRKASCAICASWILALTATVIGTVPAHNIEMGSKTVFYYRIAYIAELNSKCYIILTILAILIPVTVVSMLTVFKTIKNKWGCKKSRVADDSSTQNPRRNIRGMAAEKSILRSASTIMSLLLAYTVCIACGLSFMAMAMIFGRYTYNGLISH